MPRVLLPGLNGYYGDDPRDQGDILLGVNDAIRLGFGP